MNAQQARLDALLEEAADDFDAFGTVDMALQVELVGEGYVIDCLDHDLTHILNNR